MALMNTLNSPTWKIKQRHQFSQNKCLYLTLWINSVDAVSLVVCESSHMQVHTLEDGYTLKPCFHFNFSSTMLSMILDRVIRMKTVL